MEYRTPPSTEPPSLREAIRKARLDDAERAAAIADLRGVELARLEVLSDLLAPVFAQLPEGVDLFDHGLVPGEHPRLYVDMLAYVEMARGTREYRFVQDTRWGQRLMAESEDVASMRATVTNYVALRLIEREKALRSDSVEGRLNRAERGKPLDADAAEARLRAGLAQAQATQAAPAAPSPPADAGPERQSQWRRKLDAVVWLLIGAFLGVVAYAFAWPWFVQRAL
ncbi:hypothetical protein [Labrys wisconsinensis]|uniref:Type IV / VI secretion system DotU domain-containing protein n=1 Tax=Labrys wisconsinensis TaxID=425677 RepID=A0ABU0JH36_9HYPH|nr:hypothetical protein [Labrys wisconsinensis]MDQ0473600.1 hypothetical protein [Labrys wisconsinensis]